MGNDGESVIRRFYELSTAGDPACWWEGLTLDGFTELPDGRLLADVTFDLAGKRSGAPFHKRAAVIYTVGEGKIVRAEHFMDRSAARDATGA